MQGSSSCAQCCKESQFCVCRRWRLPYGQFQICLKQVGLQDEPIVCHWNRLRWSLLMIARPYLESFSSAEEVGILSSCGACSVSRYIFAWSSLGLLQNCSCTSATLLPTNQAWEPAPQVCQGCNRLAFSRHLVSPPQPAGSLQSQFVEVGFG